MIRKGGSTKSVTPGKGFLVQERDNISYGTFLKNLLLGKRSLKIILK